MEPSPAWRVTRPPQPVLTLLAGLGAVAAARLSTLPRTLWEWDEVLFVRAVERFDPLAHRPHPPGYPLLVGLGKGIDAFVHDPFASLVALSVLASLGGFLALAAAYRRLALDPAAAGEPGGGARALRTGVAGALLFHLSAAMLVYGPLALSDPPALLFLSLALAAAARLAGEVGERPSRLAAAGLGAAASAAVGCRPQLAVAVLPMLAAAVWVAPRRRRLPAALVTLAVFALLSLAWFVPLLLRTGGWGGLLAYLGKQAGWALAADAARPRLVAGGGAAASLARAGHIAARFVAHPWGTRWTSVPVLALAAAGIAGAGAEVRRRALPLAVFAGVSLAFGLLVMNPDDAVRYALPSLLGVAFAAALGLEALAGRLRRPAVAVYGAVALLAAGSAAYAAPLLLARARSASPPVAALRWAARALPPNAVVLIDDELAAHASHLLPRAVLAPAEPGLARYAGERTAPLVLLAEGESRWPGAATFRWPASDAYGKLTRGHYRVVSVSPIPPERRYAALAGVYACEPSLRQAGWRWLDERAAIRLFPAGARRVAVTLALPPVAPWPANRVAISVAGAEVTAVDVPRGGRSTAVLPLPASGAVEIGFRSRASFVPSSADRRRLAVQLLDVERPAA